MLAVAEGISGKRLFHSVEQNGDVIIFFNQLTNCEVRLDFDQMIVEVSTPSLSNFSDLDAPKINQMRALDNFFFETCEEITERQLVESRGQFSIYGERTWCGVVAARTSVDVEISVGLETYRVYSIGDRFFIWVVR